DVLRARRNDFLQVGNRKFRLMPEVFANLNRRDMRAREDEPEKGAVEFCDLKFRQRRLTEFTLDNYQSPLVDDEVIDLGETSAIHVGIATPNPSPKVKTLLT